MSSFATSDDYVAYTGGTVLVPDDLDLQLRDATRLVRRAVRNAFYAVDTDGNATDEKVIDALRDATCAQVQAWVRLKIDRTAGGVVTAGTVTSKSIGSASVSYGDANAAAAARTDAVNELVPAAWDILHEARLLTTVVWTHG